VHVNGLGAGLREEPVAPSESLGQCANLIWTVPEKRSYRVAKRIIDVVFSGLFLLVGAPFLAVVALAIKLDSRGPVIFKQTRVGRGGRHFTFYKFRSMAIDAERRKDEIEHLNEVSGPVFKVRNDPRVTRVGRILRRFSLDELPQFYNVLKGDMSLVGPRPPLPEEVRRYQPWHLKRLSVTPGITCLWQVNGRSRIGFDEWVRLDLEYIAKRSILLDVIIIARTVPAVLTGDGAY